MPNNPKALNVIPGKTVPGARGYGKVQIIYKPKVQKRLNICGIIVYLIFFSLLFTSYSWTRPYLKYNSSLPAIRSIFSTVDNILLFFNNQLETIDNANNANNIPTIHAENSRDLIFKQGYLHAQDRLLQLEIYRRAAHGNLSTWFGNKTLHDDMLAKTLNFVSIAEADYTSMDFLTKDLLHAYCDGVNSYLGKHANQRYKLPLDFHIISGLFSKLDFTPQPWTPIDTLSILRFVMYAWSRGSWEEKLINTLTKEEFLKFPTKENEKIFTFFDYFQKKSKHENRKPTELENIFTTTGLSGTIIAMRSADKEKAFLLADIFTKVIIYISSYIQ